QPVLRLALGVLQALLGNVCRVGGHDRRRRQQRRRKRGPPKFHHGRPPDLWCGRKVRSAAAKREWQARPLGPMGKAAVLPLASANVSIAAAVARKKEGAAETGRSPMCRLSSSTA